MKLLLASTTLGLATLAIVVSTSAVAEDSGLYIGASAGQSRARIDENKITSTLLDTGIATTNFTEDNKDFSYKAFVGYQFNKYFAVESGYFKLGSFDYTATTLPAGTLKGSIELEGVNLDVVGSLPITEKFSAFGRVGMNYAKASDTFSGTGAVHVLDPDRSKRDANYKLGLGLQYDFTRSFGMRVEAERYRINDAVGNKGDIDVGTAGVLYRFGRHSHTYTSKQSTPIPPVVIDAPIQVVVPAPVHMQKYCSILDLQFEINQDDIQRAEKEKLSVVGTFLTKYPDTTAVIEGHTDNVGSNADNMALSQRRAESVVSYLEEHFHIDASRLTAVGYGETRPIGDNNTQEGKRMNRRIDAVIACATDIAGLNVAPARMTMALMIEFEPNKADISVQDHEQLRQLADFLKANPSVTAMVEGHTGNLQATPALAMQISQRRAQNVVNYLADNFGIARSRLAAQGFGETRRFAYNTNAEGQQDNRRINVIIDYHKK